MSRSPPARTGGAGAGAAGPIELSIVIPAYNEEDNVGLLYDALMASVPALGRRFEVIVVDDGSHDRTFERLAALAARDPRLRVIKLRRNHGQTPAMVAGIDHARGHIVVTMDADLQNDPADIARLLAKLEQGHDLVVGWRQHRHDRWLSRRLPSLVANWLIATVTGVRVKDNGCTLKAFRAELIKELPLYSEMHRFIPAMMSIRGCRLAELEVRHHPRRHGTSKYGLSRTYKVCFDLIAITALLAFARKPMFCFVGTAGIALLGSLIFLAVALYHIGAAVDGSPVVFMGLSILLGSLAVFLGLIGVLIALIHRHVVEPEAPPADAAAVGEPG